MIKPMMLVFSLCLAVPVSAEIYRWIDENGRVHYGERPPHDTAERVQLPREATPTVTAPAADETERRVRQRRMLDAFSHEREQKKAQRAREEKARQRLAQDCERIKRRWKELNYGGPIYYEQPDGGRRYVDDAERAAELDALRPAYRKACGADPK